MNIWNSKINVAVVICVCFSKHYSVLPLGLGLWMAKTENIELEITASQLALPLGGPGARGEYFAKK